jgi:hypothetical protein
MSSRKCDDLHADYPTLRGHEQLLSSDFPPSVAQIKIVAAHSGGSGVAFAWESQFLVQH